MHRGPGLSEVHPIELDPLNAKRVPITCRHPFSVPSSAFCPPPIRTENIPEAALSRDAADVDQVSKVYNGETVESSSRKRVASSTNTVSRMSGCTVPQLFRELTGCE